MPHAFSSALHGVLAPIVKYLIQVRIGRIPFGQTFGLNVRSDIRHNPDTDFDN